MDQVSLGIHHCKWLLCPALWGAGQHLASLGQGCKAARCPSGDLSMPAASVLGLHSCAGSRLLPPASSWLHPESCLASPGMLITVE